MERSEWAVIAIVVVAGGVIVWTIVVVFRWLASRSWSAILSQTDSGIHLTSEEGGITLTRDSEHKLLDIENPLQGFIHNEVEKDEQTDNYTINEVEGNIIINHGNDDATE